MIAERAARGIESDAPWRHQHRRGADSGPIFVLVVLVVVVAALVGLALPATAQIVPEEQPPFVPRVTGVLSPIPVYADPTVSARATGLVDLSLPSLQRQVARIFAHDPRFAVVPPESLRERTNDLAGSREMEIAERLATIGIEYYRSYNLASSVDQLREAAETYESAGARWFAPDRVGDVHLTRALANLELASLVQGAERRAHESAALHALEQLIRVDPARRLTQQSYPPAIVDAYERAYLGLLFDDAPELRLTAAEARRAADVLELDQVVYLTLVTGREDAHIGLQVWDAVEQRFVVDTALPIEQPTTAGVLAVVEQALSRAIACQPLVEPPAVPDADTERHVVYLNSGWATQFFLDTPSRRPFVSNGFAADVTWMLSENFGLFGRGYFFFGIRDRDGDLLRRVDTGGVSLGSSLSVRLDRVRLYLQAALEAARVGEVRATTDFWCKVSGGELDRFDEERACEPGEIVTSPDQAQVGVGIHPGVAVQLFGPIWIDTQFDFTMFFLPFSERTLDRPIGGQLSLGYRFR